MICFFHHVNNETKTKINSYFLILLSPSNINISISPNSEPQVLLLLTGGVEVVVSISENAAIQYSYRRFHSH